MATLALPMPATSAAPDHDAIPQHARVLVWSVIAAVAVALIARWPVAAPTPALAVFLLLASVVLSVMKLRLPLARSHATISMAYAIDFAALLLCGADVAMVIASIGVLVQCAFRVKVPQPAIRMVYSVATAVLSVQAAGLVWNTLRGDLDALQFATTIAPMLVTAVVYFIVNTGLIALAIGLTTAMAPVRLWHDEFLWSAPNCFLSAAAGTMVAIVVSHGAYAMLALVLVPVYISQRAYQASIDRIDAERSHADSLSTMVMTTQDALARATASEYALHAEKERLALERTRMAITLETIADAVITVDRAGHVLLLNKSAATMARYATGEGVDRPVADLFSAIGLLPDLFEPAIARVQGGETVQIRSSLDDTVMRVLEITGTPMRDGDDQPAGAVWVLRDVTDAMQMEQERSKAARLESLGVLAGGLAHDFNNMLMGVVGNLSLARTLVGRDDEGLTHRLGEAEAACVRARGVTGQLLTFAKGGSPVKTTASLEELVTECARFALSGSPVAPRYTIEPNLWNADIDTVQISQVVHNLVLNAVQAMPGGGMVDIALHNVRINDDATGPANLKHGAYVCLSIQDRGAGIAFDHLPHIFEPYFTTKKKGSGLGLAISSSIVRAHGGTIAVESAPNTGSRFSVYLPASIMLATAAKPREEATKSAYSGRVLLMDDDAAVTDVAGGMRESLGYQAVSAPCGTIALERLMEADAQGRPFDLVILDLTVPGGMGGQETITHVRAIRPDVPVIVTSGYADNSVLSNYVKYGFDGVLPKPFTIPDLRTAIQNAVLKRRSQPARSPEAAARATMTM